jgi:hypothetical protein
MADKLPLCHLYVQAGEGPSMIREYLSSHRGEEAAEKAWNSCKAAVAKRFNSWVKLAPSITKEV